MPPTSDPLGEAPLVEAAGGGPIDSAAKSTRELPLPLPDGVALVKQGNLAAAEDAFRQSVGRSPKDAYRTALRLQPDFAPAHINLAHAFLALGRLEEAWMELEWQWSSRTARPYKFRKPRWSGEPLRGRTILVYADETADDIRRYVHHAAALRDRGSKVVVVCRSEMVAHLSATPGIDAVVPLGPALPDHDLYVPLLSLPWLLSRPELCTSRRGAGF